MCTQLQEIKSAIQIVVVSVLVIKCCSSYCKCIDIIVYSVIRMKVHSFAQLVIKFSGDRSSSRSTIVVVGAP